VVEGAGELLILSPVVLAELDYLVSRKLGTEAELTLLNDVAVGAYTLAAFDTADVAVARGIAKRYRDLSVGIADASVVVLARRHGTEDVLTLDDRHFRAMTSTRGRPFRLLPADR
jgi:hypothetical protein